MKPLLTLVLIITLATAAAAQLPNSMGVFFSDTEFILENTNHDASTEPFPAYLVLLESTVYAVGGYETSFSIDVQTAFILGVTGPNGWTNFGDNNNHLCGYQTPIPMPTGAAVLATLDILYMDSETAAIFLGPSEPSSVGGDGPAIVDGANPDQIITCTYTGWPIFDNIVATLNGDGIVIDPTATEPVSWTGVKSLFR